MQPRKCPPSANANHNLNLRSPFPPSTHRFTGCAYFRGPGSVNKPSRKYRTDEIPPEILKKMDFVGKPILASHRTAPIGEITDAWRDRFGGVHIEFRVDNRFIEKLIQYSIKNDSDFARGLSIGHSVLTDEYGNEKYLLREVSMCHRNARFGTVITTTMTPEEYKVFTQSPNYTTTAALSDKLNLLHYRRALQNAIMSGEAQPTTGTPNTHIAEFDAAYDFAKEQEQLAKVIDKLPAEDQEFAYEKMGKLLAVTGSFSTKVAELEAKSAKLAEENTSLQAKLTNAAASPYASLDSIQPQFQTAIRESIEAFLATTDAYAEEIASDPRLAEPDSLKRTFADTKARVKSMLYDHPDCLQPVKAMVEMACAATIKIAGKSGASAPVPSARQRFLDAKFVTPQQQQLQQVIDVGAAQASSRSSAVKRQNAESDGPRGVADELKAAYKKAAQSLGVFLP